jgi:predicted nucleic acid-binding protein
MIVLIDSGVLGLLANPNKFGEAKECEEWLYLLLTRGCRVTTSIICEYEVRRNLILESMRNSGVNSVQSLRELEGIIEFLPLENKVMHAAAKIWAKARKLGNPTASNTSIDADVILSAQWQSIQHENPGRYVVIATYNTKHLERFSEAYSWRKIKL